MNRFFGGGKNKGPSATNLQAQKSKQIESLRKVGAIEILRDVEYRVVVPQGGTNITILIHLPPQFPSEKPVLTVQPAVSHPWIDSQMKIVGCPSINNFSMHSDLGSAVQAVLDELRKTPPAIVPQHYILGYNSPTIGSGVGSAAPIHLPQGVPAYPGPVQHPQPVLTGQPQGGPPPLPPRRNLANNTENAGDQSANVLSFSVSNISAEFPELKDMKLFELEELIHNEDRIMEMVQRSPGLIKFAQQRDSLSATCVQLAQSNLSKKPEVENLKKYLIEKNAEFNKMKTDFEEACARHMSLADHYHPSNIQTNLKVAVMEADEESEETAEHFFNQELSIDEFLKKFMEKRRLCHMRRAKEEKLNQIIISQGLHF